MSASRASRASHDRGSMAVATVLVVLGVAVASMTALIPHLVAIGDRQRAQNAADAAALAGVEGGRGASVRLAASNGGALIAWHRSGAEVTVVVQVDDQVAEARATNAP
jgi:hypothetical protein